MLNAKQHEREATIVAQAGRKGAVTVATNMAGRGTDIMLGGNAEFLADRRAASSAGLDPVETPRSTRPPGPRRSSDQAEQAVAAEHDEVTELGGLYVARHRAARVAPHRQPAARPLRPPGRPGRVPVLPVAAGRPDAAVQRRDWSTAFMTTAQDPRRRADRDQDGHRARSSSAQAQVEAQNFEIRKNVLKYDDVLNRQREVIYDERRRVLEGADLHEQIRHFIDDVIEGYVDAATADGFAEDWDLEQLWTALQAALPGRARPSSEVEEAGRRPRRPRPPSCSCEELKADAHDAYDAREEALGAEVMRELERRVVLSVLDRKWREHLYEMDYLQEGIGLRAMAQRDPLVEYQREGFDMFAGDDGRRSRRSRSATCSTSRSRSRRRPTRSPVRRSRRCRSATSSAALAATPRPVADDATGLAAARRATTRPTAAGRRPFGSGVRVSGVDLDTDGQRSGALRYTAPGEDGRAVETGDQQTGGAQGRPPRQEGQAQAPLTDASRRRRQTARAPTWCPGRSCPAGAVCRVGADARVAPPARRARSADRESR